MQNGHCPHSPCKANQTHHPNSVTIGEIADHGAGSPASIHAHGLQPVPTLSLFTLAYLLSLLLFHSQVELPWVWRSINQQLGSNSTILLAWAGLCFLLGQQGGVCKSKTETVTWIFLGLLAAQLCAGVQAAAHQHAQIPLSCNKQIIESEFKLIEKAFRDKGSQTWLIQHTPHNSQTHSACVKPGARLQTFMEKADTHIDLLPGQRFKARIRIKPPKASLQLEGFDVHRHWFANQIAGTAQLKSGIQILHTHTPTNPLVWMERLRLHIANWIVQTLQDHPEQGLVLAMVVGDQGLISVATKNKKLRCIKI